MLLLRNFYYSPNAIPTIFGLKVEMGYKTEREYKKHSLINILFCSHESFFFFWQKKNDVLFDKIYMIRNEHQRGKRSHGNKLDNLPLQKNDASSPSTINI